MNKEFLQALGHLFYAITTCDGITHELELNIIEEESKNYSNTTVDLSRAEAAQVICDTVKQLRKKKLAWQLAWDVFEHYVKQNKKALPTWLTDQITKSAAQIGVAKNGLNKSELVLLSKLGILFGHKSNGN